MTTLVSCSLALLLILSFSCSSASFEDEHHQSFFECLNKDVKNLTSIFDVVYTMRNSSYTSTLQFSIRNPRFASESTSKPAVIITPQHESQVPPVIYCAKESHLQIRTRSGGHDYEGLSYVSQVPFVLLDLINLSETTVDIEEKTAWVGSGATLGSVYYRIAQKSTNLGFPGGICPSVGVGGYISGGGYGILLRKYGLAADNIIDARIVDVNGRILDRKSMGEDLFWAIRGGNGASFGVILAWKLQLVDVPETMTVFSLKRTLEQNATETIHRWQYFAPTADRDLFISVTIKSVSPKKNGMSKTVVASFNGAFIGEVDRLLSIIRQGFPELGLVREDCREVSWIQAQVFFANENGYPIEALENLLNRAQPNLTNIKVKSDYVQNPISKLGLEGALRFLLDPDVVEAELYGVPYGGMMDEIPESSIAFAHRASNLYKFSASVYWGDNDTSNSDRYINWIRRYYKYMTPYVSKSLRRAYLNYRDLDVGTNNIVGKISYARAKVWGSKYFNKNFDRLVHVKTLVDPENYFRNEQSIPPIDSH